MIESCAPYPCLCASTRRKLRFSHDRSALPVLYVWYIFVYRIAVVDLKCIPGAFLPGLKFNNLTCVFSYLRRTSARRLQVR